MKNIFFDLDGTLTDPAQGITNSVAYALSKFGIEVADRSELYRFIGPPLVPAFMEYYGFSKEDAERALVLYREYFAPTGIFENAVIEGIPEMLSALKASGKRLFVATSKPEEFAKRILEHFALDGYFDGIYGSTMDETRNTKDAVIAYALIESGADKDDTVMVGDRHHDIDGAKKNAMRSVGVLFGYGSREELTQAGADAIVETVDELQQILIGE
ncbi:MAG: HAD family hydrolase [Ruminococcaceae bacterium]|nr:HAD family hydrolase [Oscillospiraceae bacterium]